MSKTRVVGLLKSALQPDGVPHLCTPLPDGVEPPPDWAMTEGVEVRDRNDHNRTKIVASVVPTVRLRKGVWEFACAGPLGQLDYWSVDVFEPIPTEPDVVEAWELAKDHCDLGDVDLEDAGDALAAEVKCLAAELEEASEAIERYNRTSKSLAARVRELEAEVERLAKQYVDMKAYADHMELRAKGEVSGP